jgi:hypothetical protein
MSSHYQPANINFYKNIVITKETVIDLKGTTYQVEKIRVKQGYPLANRIAELLPQYKNSSNINTEVTHSQPKSQLVKQ